MKHIPVPDPIEREGRFFCPVENCSHRYATRVGYVTLESYQKHYRKVHYRSVGVGFISRIDFGSDGYRKGLLEAAAKVLMEEDVKFVVIAGGLVSKQLRAQLKKHLYGLRGDERAYQRQELLNRWAKQLDTDIPKLKDKDGRMVKYYIVVSPSTSYDGLLGMEIAQLLAKLRWRDIFIWGEDGDARFPLKGLNRDFWVLTPVKGSWRQKYQSTSVERLIDDMEKQTSQDLPDLWVIGCPASATRRPQGERKRPYVSVPAITRLQEVNTAENQEGVLVLEFFPHTTDFASRVYDFKDLVARERKGIPLPSGNGVTKLQRRVVQEIINRPVTIGMLEDALHISRGKIKSAIEGLNDRDFQPRIVLDKDSQLYAFDPSWLQRTLRYQLPKNEELCEETIVAGACPHAGAPTTEYRFIVDSLPKLILRHGATTFVLAGDIVQGLAHDLDRRGEVILGLNVTQQEILAAELVSPVMLRVFDTRFKEAISDNDKGAQRLSQDQLKELVESSLITFAYCVGNHDDWVARTGITPLEIFHRELIDLLTTGIEKTLRSVETKPPTFSVREIVEKKIMQGERHILPSGLDIAVRHPYMSRTLTASIRAEQMLNVSDCPVVVGGNFHVTIVVHRWDAEQGQRIALQMGTFMWMTEFEHQRLKTVDTGVGILRVVRYKDSGRIWMTETILTKEGTSQEIFTNKDSLQLFLEQLGTRE